MKKGQAAMEFLMTYGWAILVVLAAIGALAYFGVLHPDRFLPTTICTDNPENHEDFDWCVCDNMTEDKVRLYLDVPELKFNESCDGVVRQGASCTLGPNETGTFTLYTIKLNNADVWFDFKYEFIKGECVEAHVEK